MNEQLNMQSVIVLQRKFQVFLTRELKPFNVQTSEYYYLLLLSKADEGFFQDNFRSSCNIDKAAVTRGMQSLEKKGYIQRTPSPAGYHGYTVYPTEKFKAIETDICGILDRWYDLLCQGLTPAQIAVFNQLSNTMVDNVMAHLDGD